MKCVVSIVSALLLCKTLCTFAITYVRPTEPIDTPCPSSQDACFTLTEWIESGTHPFTNGTTVSLLSGLHFVNSTVNTLLIKHVSFIVFTGQPHEQTTVECNYKSTFGFNFYGVREVNISNIQFKFCAVLYSSDDADIVFTLAFIESHNITIMNVKIAKGGVLAVINSGEGSVFQVYESTLTSAFYLSSLLQGCLLPEKVQFVDCSCSKVIARALYDYCFEFSMQRTSIQNVTGYDEALMIDSALTVSLIDVKFWNNSAPLMLVTGKRIEFKGHILFSWNSGYGGVTLYNCAQLNIYSNATIEFSNNNIIGENLFYLNNNQFQDIETYTGVGGDETSVIAFINNTARNGGIMILEFVSTNKIQSSNTQLIFKNNTCVSSENSHAAVLLLMNAALRLLQSYVVFIGNHSPLSGGITMISGKLSITESSVNFESNHGTDGGGIALYEHSLIICLRKCNLYFDHNVATKRGGAIFIKDSDYINAYTRVFKDHSLSSFGEFVLNFSSNTATLAGDDVYGGWIDSPLYLPIITIFQYNSSDTITSNPTRICMCSNSVPVCNITKYRLKLFPGETFEIEAVAVGQRMGIVPSIVNIIESTSEESSLSTGQDVQSVGRQCTTLQFTVSTLKSVCELKLRAQDAGTPVLNQSTVLRRQLPQKFYILFQQLNITVALKNCPLGYEISQSLKKCLCSDIIQSHSGVGCDLETYSIMRSKHRWLHATVENSSSVDSAVIIIHDHCPYDYCRTDTLSLTFHLETPDKQCAFQRSGILCGACQANLSQVFGTSNCKVCSSFMTFAIVPMIIIAGILLVGFLMILNFTVSTGTINGLIFYANIVRANQAVFFPGRITTSFLSTFIAWLNLDLGIEVCFYNGLDAYAKTWFQFVFPFYIWFMVSIIITSCHYSITVSKMCGKRPVQVLATLFLLSYTKIIRVVITAFSYTVLVYPDGFSKKVWLYDGNVEFLRGKHTALFVVCFLIFLLLSVPYTISLVCIQWLQRFSHYHPFFWVNKLMPLFDAYIGPYKPKHRYWTGLLLLVRVVFLPIFFINFTNNPAINLLGVAIITSILLACLACAGGTYKSVLNNLFEIASLLNLLLLSVTTFYVVLTGQSRITTTFVSTGFAFMIFVILVFYHAGQQLMSIKKVKKCKTLLASTFTWRIHSSSKSQTDTDSTSLTTVNSTVALTSTELREPLIDY